MRQDFILGIVINTRKLIILQKYYCSMNHNTEYEKFAQQVYRELSTAEGIKTEVLKHNIRLTGKSGCKHQIDVYWEYEIAGVSYKVAIECKNYTSSVSIGKVRDFYGVLSDLENVAGIMVTKMGYQAGAKKYAAHNGINLKELRTPNESDGFIGELEININVKSRSRLFLVDDDWAKAHGFDFSNYRNFLASFMQDDKWLTADHISLETIPDGKILNKNREAISTFEELENELPPEGTVSEHVFSFEDAYVVTIWGSVKINEVKYLYKKDKQKTVFGLHAVDFVKAILKDALNGEIKLLGKYGHSN